MGVMLHNTLYRFQRGQKTTLIYLGLLFVFLSAVWWYAEIVEWDFPMEPPVVLVGGLTTIFAIYWPFKPHYADRRLRCRNMFDYTSNNGNFEIGREETEFTLHFSKASDTSIHFYNYSSDVKSVAIAKGVGQISDIKDVTTFDYSNRSVKPDEGQIVCLENTFGNFACVHIIDVKDASRNDSYDEVTFSYVINPDGGTDFS